ncbi:hypothetical protein ABRF12_004285 [Salmonella enterica]
MNRGIHPALAFAKQVEGWSPGVFSQVDKWRETDSLAPWRFMTFRQCKRRLADWLKRNPAPEEGFLCPQIMKRFPPHIVYMTLAAWRTGKTLLHCDESLFRMLGETRQTDALSGEMLRRLPFWGFWLDFPADMVFAEGKGALMGAFFTLAYHDNQTDALLALTLAQDPLSREHIPMGMEYLALTDPVSTAISQQEEGIRGFWHAVLPVLFWLCSENSEWGRQGKPVRPAPRRVGKHQRLIPPDKPVQIFAGARARFRAQTSTASAGSQYIREQSLHTPSAPAPPCQQSPLAKLLEGQTHSEGGEKYAAEMEATTNRQWQGRRFSGSGHQIHERHRHIILN